MFWTKGSDGLKVVTLSPLNFKKSPFNEILRNLVHTRAVFGVLARASLHEGEQRLGPERVPCPGGDWQAGGVGNSRVEGRGHGGDFGGDLEFSRKKY